MTTVQDIRKSLDRQLDRWEAVAAAFEAQLELTREEAAARLELQQERLEEAGRRLSDAMERTADFAEDSKATMKTAFEQLQLQMTLGGMDTRDAYEKRKEGIEKGIAAFEAQLDKTVQSRDAAISQVMDDLKKEFVRAADSLRAEADAMAAQYSKARSSAEDLWQRERAEFGNQVEEFREHLESQRQTATEQLETFQKDFLEGAQKMQDAFTRLFR